MSDASSERPGAAIVVATWFGLLAGLGESLVLALKQVVMHQYTREISFQTYWTAPLVDVCIFLVPGLVCWLLARRRPALRWQRPLVTLLGFLVSMAVLLWSYALHPLARLILCAGVGVQAGAWVARHGPLFARVRRRTLPAMAGMVLLLAAGINGSRALQERRALARLPGAPAGAPNVLLLILDTVRALDLSVYGHQPRTTPGLEALASRGVVFDRAMAPAPWTLASHAAIFTGRPAEQLSANWERPLDDRYPTLAQTLRGRGYLTAGFVANLVYTTAESGLARGFVHYDDYHLSPGSIVVSAKLAQYLLQKDWVRDLLGEHDLYWRRPASALRRDVAGWLGGHGQRPWFAFVNFYDAHNPYLPPAPWDTMFAPPVPLDQRNIWLRQTTPVTEAQARPEHEAYLRALAYLDHEVAALLEDLRGRGLLDNTIVIVTADHGEEFGEHGLLDHGNSLYLPALHVPLIVSWPGHVPEGRRIETTVSVRDLAATILDLSGGGSLPGQSLRGTWQAGGAGAGTAEASVRKARNIPSWFPVAAGDMAAAISDSLQLIRGGTGAESLYDLRADPTGGAPAPASAERAAHLRALLPRR